MAKIIKLDELVGEDKQVELHGTVYKLPPDLPVELYLKVERIRAAGARGEDLDDLQVTQDIYDELLELFRYKQPDLKSIPIGMLQATALIGLVYGQDSDEEEEQEQAPPRKRPAGTRNTRKPRS